MELDSASLADLSSQLRSLGYLARDLDLSLLFASSPASTSHLSSPSAILAHQQTLASEARAREQLVRCLWSMLGARSEVNEGFEALASRERVGNYELERVKGMMNKEKRAREVAEQEKEKEVAKTKTALAALAKEQERHRHAKDELIKARSALQMVKTQALHDQKRRETELSATMTRLQRLTSDPTQSKFVVLNPVALTSLTTSSARPSKSSMSSSRSPTPISNNSATEADVTFLQEALDGCEAERRRFESENEDLRGLVGEVGEWTEGMLEMDGVKGSEQNEAARAMEDGGDESYMIPTPHLTLPVSELSAPLYNKLYQIRVGVQALVDTTESRIEAARAELSDQLEAERKEREEEEKKRAEAEKELEDAKERIASSDQLVEDFANQRFLAGVGEDADDDDDIVAPVKISPIATKQKKTATPPAPASETTRPTFNEAQRATSVADFLADLGLDSPVVAPGAKTLSSAAPASTSSSKSSAPRQSSSRSEAPRLPKPSSRSKVPSRTAKSSSLLSPLAEESQPAAFDNHPPSPFLSSAPQPRTALAGLMAMADSPPIARVPSKSSSLLEKSKAKAREREVRGSLKENSAPRVERRVPSVF